MGRFGTSWLASEANLASPSDLSGAWFDWVRARKPVTTMVLDIDSSVSETHGAQEGSSYNVHLACTCYHPLFMFNQFGDLEHCALRPGNVHSTDGWCDILVRITAAGAPLDRSARLQQNCRTASVCHARRSLDKLPLWQPT